MPAFMSTRPSSEPSVPSERRQCPDCFQCASRQTLAEPCATFLAITGSDGRVRRRCRETGRAPACRGQKCAGISKNTQGHLIPMRFAFLSLHSTKHGSPFRPVEPSPTRPPGLNLRGRYSRNILLMPPSTASVTKGGYATALSWPWRDQICNAGRLSGGKAASLGGVAMLRRGQRPTLSRARRGAAGFSRPLSDGHP
jgi:hypothetical protein